MIKQTKPATVLDVSRGIAYGFIYNPVIGQSALFQYPFVTCFRSFRRTSK